MEDAILIIDENGLCQINCICGSPLGFIKDHDTISYEGETYTQFIKYCGKGKCSLISHYEVDISIDSRKVFVFPQDKIKKIVREDNKTKINNKEEIEE